MKDAIAQFIAESQKNPHINADITSTITREIKGTISDDKNIGSMRITMTVADGSTLETSDFYTT